MQIMLRLHDAALERPAQPATGTGPRRERDARRCPETPPKVATQRLPFAHEARRCRAQTQLEGPMIRAFRRWARCRGWVGQVWGGRRLCEHRSQQLVGGAANGRRTGLGRQRR
jgi:hypothetical protein